MLETVSMDNQNPLPCVVLFLSDFVQNLIHLNLKFTESTITVCKNKINEYILSFATVPVSCRTVRPLRNICKTTVGSTKFCTIPLLPHIICFCLIAETTQKHF